MRSLTRTAILLASLALGAAAPAFPDLKSVSLGVRGAT